MKKEGAKKVDLLLAGVEGVVEAVELELSKIVPELRPKEEADSEQSIHNFYIPVGLVETTKIAKRIYDLKDRFSAIKALFEKLNDMFAKNVLPELIAEEGLKSPVKIDGVTKLVVRNDLYLKNMAAGENEQKFFDWLIGIGQSDLIKETVNASSLKSSIKAILEANNALLSKEENRGKEIADIAGYTPIPEDILKVTPYQMVSFNKL